MSDDRNDYGWLVQKEPPTRSLAGEAERAQTNSGGCMQEPLRQRMVYKEGAAPCWASEPWPDSGNYSDPTPEMLKNPQWNAIWEEIKHWDINVPSQYNGYSGATGNHATAIFKAINRLAVSTPPVPDDEPISIKDWNLLLLEICNLYALVTDDEDWKDADVSNMEEFDPWHALKKLAAALSPAQAAPTRDCQIHIGRREFPCENCGRHLAMHPPYQEREAAAPAAAPGIPPYCTRHRRVHGVNGCIDCADEISAHSGSPPSASQAEGGQGVASVDRMAQLLQDGDEQWLRDEDTTLDRWEYIARIALAAHPVSSPEKGQK